METIVYITRDHDHCVSVYNDADAQSLLEYFHLYEELQKWFPWVDIGKVMKVRITIEEVTK